MAFNNPPLVASRSPAPGARDDEAGLAVAEGAGSVVGADLKYEQPTRGSAAMRIRGRII